jgi:hypothetical protein
MFKLLIIGEHLGSRSLHAKRALVSFRSYHVIRIQVCREMEPGSSELQLFQSGAELLSLGRTRLRLFNDGTGEVRQRDGAQ